jgi:hypothetical protein
MSHLAGVGEVEDRSTRLQSIRELKRIITPCNREFRGPSKPRLWLAGHGGEE